MSHQLDLPLDPPPKPLLQLWTPDEIYDRLTSDNIHLFHEDRRVERKSAKVDARVLSEYLSMWSNTHPHGGLILIGIEDDGRLTGCNSLPPTARNRLDDLLKLCPDARFANKEISVVNSKGEQDYILAYRVRYREDKLVETTSSEAFVREADRKVRLSDSLKREVRIAKGEIHYELEPTNLVFPDDFDGHEIDRFCEAFASNRGFRQEKSTIDLMVLAKLGKRIGARFVPNLACALLFAKDVRDVVPGARIRIIKYEGTQEQFGEELNSVFSTFVDGCIPKLLADAKTAVSSQVRVFQKLRGGKLVSTPEYPESAWFEALVNAVAHRSYNFKTQNIFVKIFDDRLVVESPGGFVPPTTSSTVYDAHNPRNPFLMEAMMHFDLTFCGFEGTRRMRHDMHKAGLPEPKWQQREVNGHQIHVTLHNDPSTRRTSQASTSGVGLPNDVASRLGADELKIVTFLVENVQVNITTIALLVGKSWPTANRIAQGLLEAGLIELVNNRGKKHDSRKAYRLKRPQSS